MLISNGNIVDYNSIMSMSVEDFLIRFKVYVNEIESIQKHNSKNK